MFGQKSTASLGDLYCQKLENANILKTQGIEFLWLLEQMF